MPDPLRPEPPDYRTPPLGGVACPDPGWVAGRALMIQGLDGMVGPRWIVMVDGAVGPGFAPGPAPGPVPPSPLPDGPEGAIPYLDDLRTP
jgi:hypothetical protein